VIAQQEPALVRKIILAGTGPAGIAAGIHTPDGATASRRLAQGYTFASSPPTWCTSNSLPPRT
jgi:4-hydroxy-2-oxoheptanedioate aldolase